MDKHQLQWLHPSVERFSSAHALWSKISSDSKNAMPFGEIVPNAIPTTANSSISSAIVSPQRAQLPNLVNSDRVISFMLDSATGCRQQKGNTPAIPIIVPSYQQFSNEVMMAPWTEFQCDDHVFCQKFQRISPAVDSLHKEIIQFYEYMTPLRVERVIRKKTVQRISSTISEKLPDVSKVSCFGSYKTGLCLPTSDIDLVVFGEWTSPPLAELKNILIDAGVSNEANIKVLDRASVPILKLTDAQTNIRFDISFNMSNGTRSILIIKQFLAEFPALKYLVIVLKHFLVQRCLNEVFTGGIGSYTLIMMTVSLLQLHPRMNCRVQARCNLGQLLLDFFELYGRLFNYQRVGIRVLNGGSYVPKEQLTSQFSVTARSLTSTLCLEDPLDCLNDIGRGSYATFAFCLHFENAFVTLERCVCFVNAQLYHRSLKDPNLIGSSHMSILGRIVSVSAKLLHSRNYLCSSYELTSDDCSSQSDAALDDENSVAESVGSDQHQSENQNPEDVISHDKKAVQTAQFFDGPSFQRRQQPFRYYVRTSDDGRPAYRNRHPGGRRFYNRRFTAASAAANDAVPRE